MSLIVDAYNVLHCTHVLPPKWQDVGAAGLCQMISKAGPVHGRAVVVCDGAPPGGPLAHTADAESSTDGHRHDFGRVQLLYAGGGRDADSLIESLIKQDHAPRELIVVSNDRRIQRAARRRKAVALGSETFLRRLTAGLGEADRPTGPEKPRHEPNTDHWLKKFGYEPDPPAQKELDSETDHWLREFGFIDDDGE